MLLKVQSVPSQVSLLGRCCMGKSSHVASPLCELKIMNLMKKLTEEEQKLAMESSKVLTAVMRHLTSDKPEIQIEQTNDRIKIPLMALKLLEEILRNMSQGKPTSLAAVAAEVTPQKGAEILGCSRLHYMKILEEEKIKFNSVGRHKRIKLEDIMNSKWKLKKKQKENLIKIMESDEELGLYDS